MKPAGGWFILNGIHRSLLRGFQVLAKSIPEGVKFRNTPSACGEDRNFEEFASLFVSVIHHVRVLPDLPVPGLAGEGR